jgi:hypothetical protein
MFSMSFERIYRQWRQAETPYTNIADLATRQMPALIPGQSHVLHIDGFGRHVEYGNKPFPWAEGWIVTYTPDMEGGR